jgi:hypothetical protein
LRRGFLPRLKSWVSASHVFMNPEREQNTCDDCGTVNPGDLKQVKGKILWAQCRTDTEKISERTFTLIEFQLGAWGITRPTIAEIAKAGQIKIPTAGPYLPEWKLRHPEYYNNATTSGPESWKPKGKDGINQAICGEKIGATTTPELSKAMKEAETKEEK